MYDTMKKISFPKHSLWKSQKIEIFYVDSAFLKDYPNLGFFFINRSNPAET